mmetsp:Transcript_146223/g.266597  ORF Transcript_146223/g.266597 Transcript_146223/m.266597 type:complete len:396 (-) Transcript_146223:362-1549(-)
MVFTSHHMEPITRGSTAIHRGHVLRNKETSVITKHYKETPELLPGNAPGIQSASVVRGMKSQDVNKPPKAANKPKKRPGKISEFLSKALCACSGRRCSVPDATVTRVTKPQQDDCKTKNGAALPHLLPQEVHRMHCTHTPYIETPCKDIFIASSTKTRHAAQVASGRDLTRSTTWIKEVLAVHNMFRARHGAPPLEWDNSCAQRAQQAANACAARGCMFHNNHREHGHGQNIFFGTPGHFSAADAIQAWYDEVAQYTGTATFGTGHFTQLVWLSTTHVGMSCDSMGKGYIVANYSPPGNMQPANPNYLKNVLPLGSPLQTRPKQCTVAKTLRATSLTAEVQEIFDSIPHEEIKLAATQHLAKGGKAEFAFKPSPHGSITLTLFLDRGTKVMKGNW